MTTIASNADRIEVRVGGSFMGLLCILFIALKLTHTIDWSWWWVLAPVLWPLYLVYYIIVFAFWAVVIGGAVALVLALLVKLLNRA